MYLNVPSGTPTNVQLQFNFGPVTTARSWNIKIGMIPCGASYAGIFNSGDFLQFYLTYHFFLTRSAPSDCLQYFTGSTGTVSAFNWKDVAGTATRQLANMNYKSCFRTESINSKVS